MPFNDGTGPRGQGPMTGGGFGTCAPGSRRWRAWPLVGLGLGLGARWAGRRFGARYFGRRGLGGGAGWGYVPADDFTQGPWVEPTQEEEARALEVEAQALREEASFLQRQMEALEARIATLRGSEGAKEAGQDG